MIDAEVWVTASGFSEYDVSSTGRTRKKTTRALCAENSDPYGYIHVNMKRDDGKWWTPTVHILVAKAFVPGEAPGLQVNHKDTDKLNNRWDNLEWVTRKENIAHAFAMGTIGPRAGISRRPRPCRIVETGERFPNASACARALGVSHSMVGYCLRGEYHHNTVKGYHIVFDD